MNQHSSLECSETGIGLFVDVVLRQYLWQPLFFNVLPNPSASKCKVRLDVAGKVNDLVGRAFDMQAR